MKTLGILALYLLLFAVFPWVMLGSYYLVVWFGRYTSWVIGGL